jgi:hypothetical protein
MQPAILIGLARRVKSRLPLTVSQIIGQQEWRIEENLLDFGLGDTMLLALPGVSFIRVESNLAPEGCFFLAWTFELDFFRSPLSASAA